MLGSSVVGSESDQPSLVVGLPPCFMLILCQVVAFLALLRRAAILPALFKSSNNWTRLDTSDVKRGCGDGGRSADGLDGDGDRLRRDKVSWSSCTARRCSAVVLRVRASWAVNQLYQSAAAGLRVDLVTQTAGIPWPVPRAKVVAEFSVPPHAVAQIPGVVKP
jgi:hypothetical protein